MKIFYNEKMISDQSSSGSRSSLKPKLFLDFIKANPDLINNFPYEIIEGHPIKQSELYLVHLKDYVDGVFRGDLANGFMNYNLDFPRSTLYTIGSLYQASLWAYQQNTITLSPTSGFHHAGFDHGGGFCTFNGLAYVAHKMSEELKIKIGVVDLDFHFPDGTIDILSRIKNPKIFHYYVDGQLKGKNYLNFLAEILVTLKTLTRPDFIIFQIAADTYLHDPLGGSLTIDELKLRDSMIADFLVSTQIPMSWCFGGGYTKDYNVTLGIHAHTFGELIFANEKMRIMSQTKIKRPA